MPENFDSVRKQLLTHASKKRERILDQPRNWKPYEVLNPATNQPFTMESAWEFVVEVLQNEKYGIEEVMQENPPGKKAYVLIVEMSDGKELYIKLRLGTGKILGRSFHYSKGRDKDAS